MTLSPKALATLGLGYPPAVSARLGLWPADEQGPVEPPGAASPHAYGWRGPLPLAEARRRMRLFARAACRVRVALGAEAAVRIGIGGATAADATGAGHAVPHIEAASAATAAAAVSVRPEPFISQEEAAALAAWVARFH